MVLGTSTYRFLFRAGLLAHGSSYSPCLPIFLAMPTRWRVMSRCSTQSTRSPLPVITYETVAFAGFVPIYSGGTTRDSHPLPLPGNH